jgi:hypothetical protein
MLERDERTLSQEQKAPPPNSACDCCTKPMRKSSEVVWKNHELCYHCFLSAMDAKAYNEMTVAAWIKSRGAA